jgi:glucose dehydrogenase
VLRGHEGGPLVIGDVMYIHTPFPNKVFALDLNDRRQDHLEVRMRQDSSVIPVMCCDTVNRGVAYGDGKIFLYQADTTLVALDAEDRRKALVGVQRRPEQGRDRHQRADGGQGQGLPASPAVSSACVASDRLQHRRRLAWPGAATAMGPDSDTLMDPPRPPISASRWARTPAPTPGKGDQWKIGGGTTWGWYSYDPELNLVYYGSGNPSTWNPVQRPGDNRWSMTIWARDADTGMAKWVYQMTPHDEWDYDGVNEMILAEKEIDGEQRKVLVHFDRNGFAYTMDRVNGDLLVAEKYDPAVNWATHVDMETGRPQVVANTPRITNGEDVNTTGICPAALGTKDQQPASFSPKSGVFYVPTNHVCMDYEPFQVSYTAGQPYVGATLSMYPAPGGDNLGNFIAWDAVEGKILWSNPEKFSVWSGALATAGDVVFYGTLEGYLKAVDAATGEGAVSSSRPRPASSATSTPMSTTASSTSPCSRASAAGPASAWPPAWWKTRRPVSARWAPTPR